jgi:hypothetical protein
MVMAPLYARVLSKAPQAHAGSAAGVLSTVQQIGNASGVAAIGATYFRLAGSDDVRIAVIICLALLIAAFSLLALVLRGQKRCERIAAAGEPANDVQGNALASVEKDVCSGPPAAQWVFHLAPASEGRSDRSGRPFSFDGDEGIGMRGVTSAARPACLRPSCGGASASAAPSSSRQRVG